jgi:Glucose / Sorbosone dehydrogenase
VVDCCGNERGGMSMAPAPDFDRSGRFYVFYTGKEAPGEIHVAELRADGDSADIGTLRNVLTVPHPGESNHNGGQLQFGPDGYLYVATGDGGGSDDEHHNSQSLGSLLGKVLRIDPRASGERPYTVPAGNPFPAAPAPYDTIWSYGLRNPFRFSFDRGSGDLVIGDVGQGAEEEVDHAPAPGLGGGANYGWNCREGSILGPATDQGCKESPPGAFVEPVFDYPHTPIEAGAPERCAIIGGYVVHDPGLAELAGRYLYGDLCSGEVRSLSFAAPGQSDRSESITVPELNSFGEDACGRVYTVSGKGQVSRLLGGAPTICPLAPSRVRISSAKRRVKRGRRAMITAFLSPCPITRRGDPIKLTLGRRTIQSRRLDRACSARFTPRIRRVSGFRAKVAADGISSAALSRRLTIRPLRPHHHRHRR